jgi:hypothetical protein
MPGVPYRVPGPALAGASDGTEEDEEADELPDAQQLRRLLEAWRECFERLDGPAMLQVGRAALDAARSDRVRQVAAQVIAHGLALSGDEQAAIAALERDGDAHVIEIQVDIHRRARRYRKALELVRGALETSDDTYLASLVPRLEDEWRRWEVALLQLAAAAEVVAEDYGLVREAGRIKGRNDDAARVGERMFELRPDPDLAWAIAGCWARAFDRDRAAAWLVRAGEAGSRDLERYEASAELALLHAASAHETVRAALGAGERAGDGEVSR